jgi:hypothetical protein
VTVTLAQLEQAVARKVGPYYQLAMDRQSPTTANFQRAFFPGLRSTVELDLVTNLYLLRRGIDYLGAAVPVSTDDRQRTVANYDPQQGMVEVDQPWSITPAVGEMCEFHHLDPALELRPVVLAGLRRCFLTERYSLGNGYFFEGDLTASLPWLTNPSDVLMLETLPFPTGFSGRTCEVPFVAFVQSGNVCIRVNSGTWGPYYGGLLVTIARSHFNFVNGLETTVGPTQDTDTLAVDVDYAAAAGHIEAWHNVPAKLQAAAAGNLQATQAMAAAEFSRQALIHAPKRPSRWGFDSLVGTGTGGLLVVNA